MLTALYYLVVLLGACKLTAILIYLATGERIEL